MFFWVILLIQFYLKNYINGHIVCMGMQLLMEESEHCFPMYLQSYSAVFDDYYCGTRRTEKYTFCCSWTGLLPFRQLAHLQWLAPILRLS
jgi:hypothetical protein